MAGSERLHCTVRAKTQTRLRSAAQMKHQSLTECVVSVAQQRGESVLSGQTTVPGDFFNALSAALSTPAHPNDAMQRIARSAQVSVSASLKPTLVFVWATHDAAHSGAVFDTANPTLNDWLVRYARTAQAKRIAQAVVWTQADDSVVRAYFTLSAQEIVAADLPRRMPERIPAVLLGKLALDRRLQGKGLGAQLLLDAYQRVSTQTVTAPTWWSTPSTRQLSAPMSTTGFYPRTDPTRLASGPQDRRSSRRHHHQLIHP